MAANAALPFAVEFVGLTKRFGALVANDQVSFGISAGTIHGIVGENGAGKSTLMSALFGLYKPDGGEIRLRGRPVEIDSPATAIKHGIGMVHQHFMLVERLTALQNVIIGAEDGFWLKGGVGNARKRVEEIQRRYGLPFPLDAITRDLPVGVQQRIEIVKSIYRNADILILDEPTSVLTPNEVQGLFAVFRELTAEGRTVVLITHKLQEILAISDNVTVLRQAKAINTLPTREVTKLSLAEMMVGRKLAVVTDNRLPVGGEVSVDVQSLTVRDAAGTARVVDLSFDIRKGEILGIAGVSGNGQTELLSCLAGQVPPATGKIRLGGLQWTAERPATASEIRSGGVAQVPEDRLRHGLIGRWPARDNSVLGLQHSGKVPGMGRVVSRSKLAAWCRDLMARHDVRPPDPSKTTSLFSGGNQQKLVIGRELSTDPDIILIGQPTRGVDIGAIESIHASLMQERARGKAILVVSVELDEVMALSDRILVMFEGRSMGVIDRRQFNEKVIGLMMAGTERAEALQQVDGKAVA